MNPFKVHSIDSAPESSQPMLEESVKSFGMLPNLHAVRDPCRFCTEGDE